jgi:hypothetical protein
MIVLMCRYQMGDLQTWAEPIQFFCGGGVLHEIDFFNAPEGLENTG